MSAVLELRHQCRACLKLAEETDSKKEEKDLLSEARELQKQLQKVCPHELIIEVPGRTYTEEEVRSLNRYWAEDELYCLFCGKNESNWLWSPKPKEIRAKYYGRTESCKQLTKPLRFLLSELEEWVANEYKS